MGGPSSRFAKIRPTRTMRTIPILIAREEMKLQSREGELMMCAISESQMSRSHTCFAACSESTKNISSAKALPSTGPQPSRRLLVERAHPCRNQPRRSEAESPTGPQEDFVQRRCRKRIHIQTLGRRAPAVPIGASEAGSRVLLATYAHAQSPEGESASRCHLPVSKLCRRKLSPLRPHLCRVGRLR